MAERFQYAIWRVVPDIERGEQINVGVVVHCRRLGLLAAKVELDRALLAQLAPGADADAIEQHLRGLVAVADGDPAAGNVALMDRSDRFGWLTAPSSTIVQPSAVHTGLCEDPGAQLEHLFSRLVRRAG